MSEVMRENRATGVRIERHGVTYRVIAAGEEIVATRVLSLAEIEYEAAVERLGAHARSLREAETAYYTLQAVRSDSFARRAAVSRKKGGKGGRGGV